jgi:hypothetical protein
VPEAGRYLAVLDSRRYRQRQDLIGISISPAAVELVPLGWLSRLASGSACIEGVIELPDDESRGHDPREQAPLVPKPTRRDRRLYFALMGTCVVLIILAWQVVYHFSLLAAVLMSAAALVLPPIAAITANRASAVDRRPPPPFQHH